MRWKLATRTRCGAAAAVMLESCIAPPTEPPKPASVPQPVSTPAPEPPLPPPRNDGRLPATAVPLHYRLDFDIDPRLPTFFGTTTISLAIEAPTHALVLHGKDLSVRSAIVRGAGWEAIGWPFTREEPGKRTEELVVNFTRELPKGTAELTIAYQARFESEPKGLFRVQDSGRWYAFTQFEPCWARKAFPSFDEPGFKVPFDVAVAVPPGMTAMSNMPEVSRTESGGDVRLEFATTPPLPSYLIALAVGELDVETGPSTPVPLRLIRVKDKAGDTHRPLELARDLTSILAARLASPFPFPKLDLLAVPGFFHGAMENAGLIAFRDDLLLLDTRQPSAWGKRVLAEVLAHEIAHQGSAIW